VTKQITGILITAAIVVVVVAVDRKYLKLSDKIVGFLPGK